MSRHKHKARGKVTQKLTRDGLVERNAATGEEERLSKRSTDFDIRQRDDAPNVANGAVNDTRTRADVHQSAKQRNRAAYRQAQERTQDNPTADVIEAKQDTPLQVTVTEDAKPDNPVVADVATASETADTPRQSEQTPFRQEHGVPQRPPGMKPKPPPGKGQEYYQQFTEPQSADAPPPPPQNIPPTLQIERESKLNMDGGGALRFSRDELPPQAHSPKRQKPKYGDTEQSIVESQQPQSSAVQPITSDLSETATLNADAPPKEPESVPEYDETPPKLQTERESKLQTDGDSALQFSHGKKPPQAHSKRPKPNYGKTVSSAVESALSPPIIPDVPNADIPTPLHFDEPEKLHFTEDAVDSTPPLDKPTQQQRYAPPESEQTQKTVDVPSGDAVPVTPRPSGQSVSDTVSETEPVPESTSTPETPQTPLKEPESALKPDKESKLQFKPDDKPPEAVKPGRKLVKAQKQADKSVKKLEAAKSRLPAKKKLRTKVVVNEESGKPKRKLYFENEVKPQGEHLKGSLPLRPVKAAGNSALRFGHGKMFQVERENVAVEAAHKAEMTAEGGVRAALRRHKTAPYRKVEKLQRKAAKKSVNLTYRQLLDQNPKLKSNIISRMFQKRKIKKDYAKAAREAQKAAKRAKKAGSVAGNAAKAVVGVIKRHPVASAVVILILLLLFCFMSLIGAFGGVGSGGLGGILSASYLAEDADADNAELAYTEWEVDLQEQIANAESSHSGYDEYRYNVGDVSHNPYELMAYLTVKYQNFTYAAIQADLRSLFAEQYALTFTPSVETRYADPTDADGDGDYEPYDYRVMTVTLTAQNFSDVIASHLSGDQFAHYAVLMQTKGARQYLSNPFGDLNWLPYVTSYYGYRIHPISGVKDYHKGVDIGLPAGTPIQAGQDGTVTFAGWSGDYGNVVVIENDKGLTSKYAHCDSLNVTTGQTVKVGDIIGTVGSTGNSTGPHLHLEVLKDGQYLNGLFFADTGSFNLTPTYGYAGTPMGDGSYAALIAEAEKYLGYPYVWGGSSPATSFDCSGFVSWVLTQSGVKNTGRLGAQGLYNICTPVSPADARPGDLIFFTGTYSAATPVTHVGIYVGGTPKKMLHCGNPISYVSIETSYWQSHFYSFGRIN